jgi:hypothetical protein
MVMAVKQFERLFREAASLDIDKSDVKRLEDFVNRRLHDLLLLGEAAAKANGRDVIEIHDLPITKGLQQQIHEFRKLDEEIALAGILEQLAKLPPLSLAYSEALEQKLPELAGAITMSLARVFKAVFPTLKNPGSAEWEQVEQIYEILL